jgi:hypothetical protein
VRFESAAQFPLKKTLEFPNTRFDLRMGSKALSQRLVDETNGTGGCGATDDNKREVVTLITSVPVTVERKPFIQQKDDGQFLSPGL